MKKENKSKERRAYITLEIMMIQQVAHHEMEVKKQTCVSWLDMSRHHQVK